jgi:hypothetical protein
VEYFSLVRPVARATENQQVRVWAHYQDYVNASVLSLDLREIKQASKMDVFMMLLQSARVLRIHDFRTAWLVNQTCSVSREILRVGGHATLEMTNRYVRSLGIKDLKAVHSGLSLLSR